MKEEKTIQMMPDSFKSILSHDKESNRVYLMKLHPDDYPDIIGYMEALADQYQYSKLFAKVPSTYGPSFLSAGYVIEAVIPGFYNNQEDAFFLVRYTSPERSFPENRALKAFQEMLLKPPHPKQGPLEGGYSIGSLHETDTDKMAKVFKLVFKTYPFPIFDPLFLIRSMQENGTRYFGVFFEKQLVAVSSAECCSSQKQAEMTDFAVLPVHRGKQLSIHLLHAMEEDLSHEGFSTLYTIARLNSLAMNKTFYNLGYQYSGTLIRNTQIAGRIESMNVWYKKI